MSTPVARKLAIALAISVGLNLFVGGMITSAWITKRAGPERPAAAAQAGKFDLRGGFEAVGRDARPIAREIRREYGPRMREAGEAMQHARRAVGEILRGDELDPEALDAAFAELRQASDAAQATMHRILLETMTRLTPEQRRAFLEGATRGRPPRGDRTPPPGGAPRGG
jgi:uncharacterized membrane protein